MKKNRLKNFYGIFGFLSLLFLAWAYIYPTYSSFPGGLDSFHYQNLSQTITYYGRIPWLLHPLSAFGLYPFSQNIGAPVLLANFNTLSGLHMLDVILTLDYIFITFVALSSYLLLYKIERKHSFALVGCFGFTMAPRILGYLVFIFEARALVVFLTPLLTLLVVMILKSNKGTKNKLIILAAILFLVLSLSHFNFIFLVPIFISSVFVKIFISTYVFKKTVRSKFFLYRPWSKKIFNLVFWLGLLAIILFSLFIISTWDLPTRRFRLEAFEERGFIYGEGNIYTIANILISMGAGAGVGLVMFGLVGFISLIMKKRKNSTQILILISFLLSIPFMMTSVYFRPFFVLYSSFFIGYGLLWLRDKERLSIIPSLIIVLILVIASIPFSNFMVQRWTVQVPENIPGRNPDQATPSFYIQQPLYESGIYLRYTEMDKEERFTTCLKPLTTSRLETLSTKIPYGNPMSIYEIERTMKQEDWEAVRNEREITRPYVSNPPRRRLYPRIFTGTSSRVEQQIYNNNITMIYSKVFVGEETYSSFMEENYYKLYEHEDGIFWKT